MATLESIKARIGKLQSEAEAIIAKRAKAALEQIRELMTTHGLTTEDIDRDVEPVVKRATRHMGKTKTRAVAVKSKLPPKYRDPKTGATWSGHARPPTWIKDVKDRSKFLIDGNAQASAAGASRDEAVSKPVARKSGVRKAVASESVVDKAQGKKVKTTASKKAATKKTVARKAVARKAAANTPTATPSAETETPAKKTAAKKMTVRKAPVSKKAAKKPALSKSVSSKAAANKTAARKAMAKPASVENEPVVADNAPAIPTAAPSASEA